MHRQCEFEYLRPTIKIWLVFVPQTDHPKVLVISILLEQEFTQIHPPSLDRFLQRPLEHHDAATFPDLKQVGETPIKLLDFFVFDFDKDGAEC